MGCRLSSKELAIKVFGWVVIGIVSVVALVGIIWGITYATADTRGAIAQNELVRADGQFRLAAYNHFFDLCSSIQGDERRIVNLQAELDRGNLTPARANTLPGIITATMNSRDANVVKYNNDAQKSGAEGAFRSAKLPVYINPNELSTTCAS